MSAPRRPHRGKKGGHEAEHEANHERWLLTYADMITLLMVLFIVLFASSTISAVKFSELADGLAKQLGGQAQVIPGGTGVLDGGQTPSNDKGVQQNDPAAPISVIQQAAAQTQAQVSQQQQVKQEQQALSGAQAKIEAALKAKGLQSAVRFTVDSRGLIVSIVTDKLLFNTGQAALQPVGDQVLDAIGPALRSLPNDISVEGHTDDVPISSGQFASNWELSAVRATTVLRYLVTNDKLQESRMSATGYADTEPVASNSTDAGRAANRRVDVVVLSTLLTSGATASDSAQASAATGSPSATPSTDSPSTDSTATPSASPVASSIIPNIRPDLMPGLAQGAS